MGIIKTWNTDLKIYRILFLSTILAFFVGGCRVKEKEGQGSNQEDYKQLALTYLSKNQLNEAEAALQKAVRAFPDDQSGFVLLSKLYLLQKDYESAENTATLGLKMQPDNEDLGLILAEAYQLRGNKTSAREALQKILRADPKSVRAYFKLADMDTAASVKKDFLLRVLNISPSNILVRLQLTELLAAEQKTDSALFYLQSVKSIAPEFLETPQEAYHQAVAVLQSNQPVKAIPLLRHFQEKISLTSKYVSDLNEVSIPKLYAGYFEFNTNIRNLWLETNEESDSANPDILNQIKFNDASQSTGLSPLHISNAKYASIAVSDYDVEGNMYVYSSYQVAGNPQMNDLFINNSGTFVKVKVQDGLDHKSTDLCSGFGDYNNDGYADLFVGTNNGILVYKNNGDETFTQISDLAGLSYSGEVYKILIADFDQDGDMDFFVSGNNGNKFFRNNGNETFTENSAGMGLGSKTGSIEMDFGDWDSDGDLDIITLSPNGRIELLDNNRYSNFTGRSINAGIQNQGYHHTAFVLGDYNNDGHLDILTSGTGENKCLLYKNIEGRDFSLEVKTSGQLSGLLSDIKINDIAFLDFDNDGYQDILVAGENGDLSKPGIKLFHNNGKQGYTDASHLLPQDPIQVYQIQIADFNFDGDDDVFLAGPTGIRLLRNDGGNLNHFAQIQLIGLSYGNSRNNRLGIGAQIEIKAGNLYQLKTVKSPLVKFGIGQRRKVDVLRIIWPNGVPETIPDPTQEAKIVEQELLKGSCPFLFTWDGEKYEFLKDMLWRSALGMPLAVKNGDTTFAFSGPSKEYLLIPGNKLKVKNGVYPLKITEELWETVYMDQIKLIAIDHPDSVNVYVDERFLPPPYPDKKIYQVARAFLPVSAVDDRGNNLLPELEAYDFNYVSNFSLGKYQGLAKEHDLILDLGSRAENDKKLHLFLRGWVMPTDASINASFTQSQHYKISPPALQVMNKAGEWQTVIKDMGYPMGRDKMVIADLSNKFLVPNDRRIRIVTNMQIYWDHIFFAIGEINTPVKTYETKMVKAELNYHGYSDTYRKQGPFGPFWLDYYTVSAGQKWRDLTGYYTRYGDVIPLLKNADDQYIIANSGDEVSIEFDAMSLPETARGWTRDFLIYSEGWVKDGDLNTVHGQTVEPLPFHNMPSYPYGKGFSYPKGKTFKAYMDTYNTRKITTDHFKNAIRQGQINPSGK